VPAPEAEPIAKAPAEELPLQEVASKAEEDELLLDQGSMMEPEREATFVDEVAEAQPETRSWVAADQAAATVNIRGATLFERMSNIARGAAKAQVEEEAPAGAAGRNNNRDSLDIPRFLNRQNNQ
jgi:cell division protein FtsZ